MKFKKILQEEIERVKIDSKDWKNLKNSVEELIEKLREETKKQKIDAEIFVGGSYVKGTLIKTNKHDIDIFVRFNWKYEDISLLLGKIVDKLKQFTIKKVHGSRDYFRLEKKNNGIIFEIIPVCKINRPKESRNVTDLSYFHVNYVKKKLNKNIGEQIMLAKRFCQAQGVYGAESYIQGFSGYGLECLVIYYKSFLKMLRELIKIKYGERIVLDPAGLYKKKRDILFEMNESKLQSPIILVDPTFKERNVLAGLEKSTLLKFQESAKNFLKKPNLEYFEIKDFSLNQIKKLKGEFLHIKLKTNRQEGDIAGTKMKKFSRFLRDEIGKYFKIIKEEFVYIGGQTSDFYLVISSKGEVLKIGPPVTFSKNSEEFKKRNERVYEKNGILYSKIKVDFFGKDFLKKWGKNYMIKIKEMGIIKIEID